MKRPENFFKILIFFFTLSIFVGGVFSGGKFLYQKAYNKGYLEGIEKVGKVEKVYEKCDFGDLNLSLFFEAYKILKENYLDPSRLVPKELIYGAIRGMVESLGDPYTNFLTPEEAKIFKEDVKGEFEGIGVEIGIKDGKLTIISPLEGTPAQRAGLKAGDVIVKINDKSTEGMNLDEAVRLIRGPKGTTVRLTVERRGWSQAKEFEIERARIQIPTIKWEKKEDILYLKIYQFLENTDSIFSDEAKKILRIPTQKMILDLRNNPGGYFEIAVKIGGWFIKKGSTIAVEETRDKGKIEYKSQGPAKFEDYKIVVLINKGTASAAEILAAALKENNSSVILIGEETFGKNTVQKLEPLSDNSMIKITIANWLTPSGKKISETGLSPDIKVEAKEEDLENGKDVQLEKAIEILKKI